MKIVFKYIKNFHDTYSPSRTSTYYAYDLSCRVDRRFLHQMIDDYAFDELATDDFDTEERIEEERQRVHELISSQDVNGLENELFEFFNFEVIEHTLQEALEEVGYEVAKSNASSSLYVKLNGKEIRISDHKRPAYDSGNDIYEEHVYDAEILTDDNRVTKKQLEKVGIKLDEEAYYLG